MDNNSNKRDGCHSFFPQIGPVPGPNDVDKLRYIPLFAAWIFSSILNSKGRRTAGGFLL